MLTKSFENRGAVFSHKEIKKEEQVYDKAKKLLFAKK